MECQEGMNQPEKDGIFCPVRSENEEKIFTEKF